MRRREVPVDEEVRKLVQKAVERVGSKRALSAELGYTHPHGGKITLILEGKRKTLSRGQLKRLEELVR
jgi:hypothetical protein